MKAIKTIFTVLLLASIKTASSQSSELVYVDQIEKNTMVYCNSCPSDSSWIRVWFDDTGYDVMMVWDSWRCINNDFWAYNGWNIYKSTLMEGDTIAKISSGWSTAWENVGYDIPFYGDSLFLVFKKQFDDSTFFYAWLRFSIEEHHTDCWTNEKIRFYLHDYAYCTIPNYPLRAGQTSLDWGIDERKDKNLIALHPNPATGMVHISADMAIRRVEVRNLLGAKVLETINPQGNNIDVSALPAGIYIVRAVTTEGKEMFAKLVKK